MLRRLALVAALWLAAVPALASVTLDGANDRLDLGTLSPFGDNLNDADGFSISLWLDTTQTSCGGLFAYSQNSATGDSQTFWWMFPCGHNGSSLINTDDRTVVNMGDCTDTGLLWQKTLANTAVNDGNLHHLLLTVDVDGTVGSRAINIYVDGTLDAGAWTKTFDDAFTACSGNPFVDWTSTVPAGARKITTGCPGACSYFDWIATTFDDYRFYTRALTAAEVTEIYRQRGRDALTSGIHRRYDFQTDCRDLSSNRTSCTAQNGPTYTTVYPLEGVRRR